MGIKQLIKNAQVDSSVKEVEVLGEKLHIRLYSVAEGEQINTLPEAERSNFLLKTCLVEKDGTPSLDDEALELLKTASDRAIGPVLKEILKYNNEAFADPKS